MCLLTQDLAAGAGPDPLPGAGPLPPAGTRDLAPPQSPPGRDAAPGEKASETRPA
jgi:hypothetical protein